MLLSKAYENYETLTDTYACCVRCKRAWVDDMELHGTLNCPKCGPRVGALYRGARDPADYGCTLDKDDHEKKTDEAVEEATPRAYNIAEPRITKH